MERVGEALGDLRRRVGRRVDRTQGEGGCSLGLAAAHAVDVAALAHGVLTAGVALVGPLKAARVGVAAEGADLMTADAVRGGSLVVTACAPGGVTSGLATVKAGLTRGHPFCAVNFSGCLAEALRETTDDAPHLVAARAVLIAVTFLTRRRLGPRLNGVASKEVAAMDEARVNLLWIADRQGHRRGSGVAIGAVGLIVALGAAAAVPGGGAVAFEEVALVSELGDGGEALSLELCVALRAGLVGEILFVAGVGADGHFSYGMPGSLFV